MTIIVAIDDSIEVDEDSFLEDEGDNSYSFRELMDMLIDKKDIILTIPTDQVAALKKGLSAIKGKDTRKLLDAGIKVGNEVLSFLAYPSANEGETCVRIKLGARKSVTILNLEIPDDKL